jgi:hypothetical protein
VLRDRGAADGQLQRQLTDGLGARGQPLEDRPSGRVSEGGPLVNLVSRH